MYNLKNLAASSNTGSSDSKLSSALLNGYLLESHQVAFHVLPLKLMANFFQALIEFLAKYQCEKTTEDMAPYCLILFMPKLSDNQTQQAK
jgi:hypothetical protein